MKFLHKQFILKIFILSALFYGGYSFAVSNFDLANLRNQSPIFTTAYDIIKVQDAWEKIQSLSPVLHPIKVGVIDTGIDVNHKEFAGESSGSSVVGKINLGDTAPDAKTDTVGHGTAVAGIIGANNLSGEGFVLDPASPQMNGVVSGVLPASKYIMEMSKISRADVFLFDNAVDLFTQSKLLGSDAVNMSFSNVKRSALTAPQREIVGGQTNDFLFPVVSGIYKLIFSSFPTTLFVVSAGNENIDAGNATPANLGGELSNVITVGGTTVGSGNIVDKRWITSTEGSNFGTTTVNISAPAESVYSPTLNGKYTGLFSGTSASAPLVTGTAGLIKSIKPDLTSAEIKQILIRTADAITTDQPIAGRLNALSAVCDPLVLNCAPAQRTVLYGGIGKGSPVNRGALITINQNTGAGTLRGNPLASGGLSGIAFDSNGTLFGSAIIDTNKLVQINPETGALLKTIGDITDGIGGTPLYIGDLAMQPGSNALFGITPGAESGGKLYTINTATGVATFVGDTGAGAGGGIAFAPDGTLYQTSYNNHFDFFSLNTLNSLNASRIATVRLPDFFDGLAVRPSDGTLFGTPGGDSDETYIINPATGSTTLVGKTLVGHASDLDFGP